MAARTQPEKPFTRKRLVLDCLMCLSVHTNHFKLGDVEHIYILLLLLLDKIAVISLHAYQYTSKLDSGKEPTAALPSRIAKLRS